jgi:rhodanese-related sulfurtransferase
MSSPTLPDPAMAEEVSPHEVAAWLGAGGEDAPVVIDCREAEELEICRIEGARWLPLGEIPSAIESLRGETARGIIISCHHGMRSLRAARYLRQHGIDRAFSMAGGIDAWSRLIDPAVPRY